MFKLINAAMIPNEGTFSYTLISRAEASAWMYQHFAHDDSVPTSYIGYEQTAKHLEALCYETAQGRIDGTEGEQPFFISVPLNRAKCSMQPGDEALVCRLSYRVENPATKGQPQPEDWEYGILSACGYTGASGARYHCETCANAMGEHCEGGVR
jgi:hypothetical protein